MPGAWDSMKAQKVRAQDFAPALLLLLGSVLASAFGAMRPAEDAPQVAAVFPPYVKSQDVMRAVARAGGRMVRTGIAEYVVVVALDEGASPSALYDAGAWLVMDPLKAGGCATITKTL